MISFARGVPAPECLPVEELADCARAVLEEDGKTILSYGSAAGYAPLREYIAQWFGVDPYRVVITNGALQGFVLLSRLVARGRRVLVEEPTYDRAIKILLESGASIATVGLDDDGHRPGVARGRAADGEDPAFLYTDSDLPEPERAHHVRRRRAQIVADRAQPRTSRSSRTTLTAWSATRASRSRPSSTSPARTFIYSCSFSKTISPGLRVGWYILPEELAGEIAEAAASTYITPVLLNQAVAFEFITPRQIRANLVRVNGLLKARRDAMLAALETHLSGCNWTHPGGGYFIWLSSRRARGTRGAPQRSRCRHPLDRARRAAVHHRRRMTCTGRE